MISQFHFKNFDADETIRARANVALGRILDRAPFGCTGVALLEKQDEGFRCSIDVYSQQGPFMASTVRATAGDAIHATQERLKNQIDWWCSHRGHNPKSEEVKILEAAS